MQNNNYTSRHRVTFGLCEVGLFIIEEKPHAANGIVKMNVRVFVDHKSAEERSRTLEDEQSHIPFCVS